MKKIVLLLILLSSLLYISCELQLGNDTLEKYTSSYVMGYARVIGYECRVLDSNTLGLYALFDSNPENLICEGDDLFREQNMLHGDVSYNKTVEYLPISYPNVFLYPDISSIEIVSSRGETVLNDEFCLRGISSFPFIQSGYGQMFDWSSFSDAPLYGSFVFNIPIGFKENKVYSPISKLVSLLSNRDLILLGCSVSDKLLAHTPEAELLIAHLISDMDLSIYESPIPIIIREDGANHLLIRL